MARFGQWMEGRKKCSGGDIDLSRYPKMWPKQSSM